MGGRVIVKSRESHYGQAPYHAHSTYIQTRNQAIRDPETKKNFTKMEKFSQK